MSLDETLGSQEHKGVIKFVDGIFSVCRDISNLVKKRSNEEISWMEFNRFIEKIISSLNLPYITEIQSKIGIQNEEDKRKRLISTFYDRIMGIKENSDSASTKNLQKRITDIYKIAYRIAKEEWKIRMRIYQKGFINAITAILLDLDWLVEEKRSKEEFDEAFGRIKECLRTINYPYTNHPEITIVSKIDPQISEVNRLLPLLLHNIKSIEKNYFEESMKILQKYVKATRTISNLIAGHAENWRNSLIELGNRLGLGKKDPWYYACNEG